MDEIASNFSYRLIRLGESFLGWLWNKLYRGLSVNGAEPVSYTHLHSGHAGQGDPAGIVLVAQNRLSSDA